LDHPSPPIVNLHISCIFQLLPAQAKPYRYTEITDSGLYIRVGGIFRRADFVAYDKDVLLNRKPVASIADPVIRFHHAITLPRLQLFQRRAEIGAA
jgi:hypothetical protein